MSTAVREAAVIFVGIVLIAAFATAGAAQSSHPAIPSCPPDAVLVGSGDYDHGRYKSYECGAAVDMVPLSGPIRAREVCPTGEPTATDDR